MTGEPPYVYEKNVDNYQKLLRGELINRKLTEYYSR